MDTGNAGEERAESGPPRDCRRECCPADCDDCGDCTRCDNWSYE